MDSLPQVIYNEICAFMDSTVFRRPALATISRQWQMAIERQTFRSIRLKSSELKYFKNVVQRHNRRRYINEIKYIIELPAYSHAARGRFEREDDRQTNNKAFTAAIQNLFHTLKSWNPNTDGSIRLIILDAYSITDNEFCRISSLAHRVDLSSSAGPHDDTDDEESPQEPNLGLWRHGYSYLELLKPDLPTVTVVTSFQIRGTTTRYISPCVTLDIVTKLPNIRKVELHLDNPETRYPAFRRLHRHKLQEAISEILPTLPSLQSLAIVMGQRFYWSRAWGLASLNSETALSDALCKTIRIITAQLDNLKSLIVTGPIDESLLWPGPSRKLSEPYWQNLEDLSIDFDLRRPFGGCYFKVLNRVGNPYVNDNPPFIETIMPPGYGYSEEEDTEAAERFELDHHRPNDDTYRSDLVPDDDSLVPLLEAFARVCSQMRVLKSAELMTKIPVSFENNTGGVEWARYLWSVMYFSPGASLTWTLNDYPAYTKNVEQRPLIWSVKDWRPNSELNDLFKDIGRERYGDLLVERFLDLKDVPWTKESYLW